MSYQIQALIFSAGFKNYDSRIYVKGDMLSRGIVIFMSHIKQFGIILFFSFAGEILNFLIPLPIPASIYGIVLLFSALMLGVVKLENVEKTGSFLIEIMPMMFIPAAVGIMESFYIVKDSFVEYIVITAVSTVIVTAVSGILTQLVIKHTGGKKK